MDIWLKQVVIEFKNSKMRFIQNFILQKFKIIILLKKSLILSFNRHQFILII